MSEANFDKTQILERPAAEPASAATHGLLRCVDISALNSPAGIEIKLESGEVTIGRGSENVVALDAHGVSRRHARLFHEDGAWQVEDLGSTNGTRVNNSKVDRCALSHGDTIAFGRVCYKFHTVKPKAGTGSVTDLDLGAANQTVVLNPNRRAAEEARAAPPASRPSGEPGAEQIYDTGTRRRVVAEPPAKSNRTAAVVVTAVVLILVAAAAAAYFLGVV